MRQIPQRKHNKTLTPYARELRKNMTPEEELLWKKFLHNHHPRFLRQKVIAFYIADFYCSKAKLVVEIDGGQHYTDEGLQYDIARTKILEAYGLKVIRFANNEVKKNFRGVCEAIESEVNERLSKLGSAGNSPDAP